MAAPFLNRNSVVLIKKETTYGTDSVPVVATDALLTTAPVINLDSQILERNFTNPTLSKIQPVVGRQMWKVSFQTELKSQAGIRAGSASAPLDLDDFLQCCGLNPTYTAETSGGANDGYVTYAPLSVGQASASLYVFPGKEVRHKITGAYGNLSIAFQAGNYPIVSCDVTGNYNAPTDTTAGTPTYATDVPVQSQSLSLAFGAVTGLVIPEFTISLNNTISERLDVNSANGLKGIRITDRRPTVKFKIQKELVATWDAYGAMAAGTTYATTFTHGSAGGTKVLVTIPKLALMQISEVEDNGIIFYDIEALCAKSSAGDDELTAKFF